MKKERGLYLRGKIYWIRYSGASGKMYYESTKTDRKTEARALLEERRQQVRERTFPALRKLKKITLEELAQDYEKYTTILKTGKECQRHVKMFLGFVGKETLVDEFADKFREYVYKRVEEGKASATIHREVDSFKRLLALAVESKKVSETLLEEIKKIKLPRIEKRGLRYLSHEEAQRLLVCCDSLMYPVVVVALYTGMRRGEILNLKFKDIDLKNRIIHVQHSKSGEPRQIPMAKVVWQTLCRFPRPVDEEAYVFQNYRTKKPYHDLKRPWKKALKKAGIFHFRFHDLRHTFASWLVMEGVSLKAVQELLGHKKLDMTIRYSHLSPEHRRQAISALDRLEIQPQKGEQQA